MAQAGGLDPQKGPEAIEAAKALILKQGQSQVIKGLMTGLD
jgi:hypothetical protein